jgi:hypothetical protein
MKKYSLLSQAVKNIFETPKKNSFKFGYYNYSPFNYSQDKLLAHKIYFEARMPSKNDIVDIGYFEYPQGDYIKVSESNAFNWQQGSMLQWLGPDFNTLIIFNDVEDNNYVSRILNLKTGHKKTLPKAIYGVDPLGKFSVTLNFERCHFTRAYSYASIVDENWDKRIPTEDGILKIDLETGSYKTIIGIQEFLDSQKIKDDGETMHWFEHIMLNNSGTRFAFYHRFGTKDSFSTQLYTADVNGNNIWRHPSTLGCSFSHLGWINDESYAVFTYPNTNLKKWYDSKLNNSKTKKNYSFIKYIYDKIVKPFAPKKLIGYARGQAKYELTVDQVGVINKLNNDILKNDGHPSFSKDGRFMLTDTYADEEGYRHLVIYDLQKKLLVTIGKFLSVFNNCGWRADLHPRFSLDDSMIVIDSAHSGYHQMLVLELDWDNIMEIKRCDFHEVTL